MNQCSFLSFFVQKFCFSVAKHTGHVRTESGNIWEGEDVLDAAGDSGGTGGGGGGGGGGLNALVNGDLVDGIDVKTVFGAMKTAQVPRCSFSRRAETTT